MKCAVFSDIYRKVKVYLASDTMQYKKVCRRLFSDMKMKYCFTPRMNIDEHQILQGFQEHVAERKSTHKGPFVKVCSKRELITPALFQRLGP